MATFANNEPEFRVFPSARRKTPWMVQYRSSFWHFKTEQEARQFADKHNTKSES